MSTRTTTATEDCPDVLLAQIVDGAANDHERDQVYKHAEECEACLSILVHLGIGRARARLDEVPTHRDDQPGSAMVDLGPGDRVGRFRILEAIGQGGMGVVFAAYDDRLERRVALKMLRPVAASHNARAAARLLREAQAMAAIDHHHVVAVLEADVHDGVPYLVMEFIDGSNVAQWLSTSRRSWKDVVTAWVDAGKGLAAAHAAGLVHRDFKPSNVLIGTDGRVRVTDFGLVGVRTPPSKTDVCSSPTSDLTSTDHIIGTPKYMAPEQYANGPVTAATDQFAYCVSLYEALTGAHPFASDSPQEYEAKVLSGGIVRAAVPRTVPRRVVKLLLRGMEVRPEARHKSLGRLIRELEGVVGRKARRTRTALGMLVVLGLVGGGVGVRAAVDHRRLVACQKRGQEVSEVWNESARAQLFDVLAATGVPFASTIAETTANELDAYSQQWQRTAVRVCRHAESGAPWTPELIGRAQWCVEERRRGLASVVIQLGEVNAQTATEIVDLAGGLAPLAPCRNADDLRNMQVPPPALHAEAAALEEELMRIARLTRAGHFDEALAPARAAVDTATALGWPRTLANAQLGLGQLLARRSELETAVVVLEDAFFGAMSAGALDIAESAATDRIVIARGRADYDDALRWVRHARQAVGELPDPGGTRSAAIDNQEAETRLAAGDAGSAQQLAERALRTRREALGEKHPEVAESLATLALALASRGDRARARDALEQALAIHEHSVGREHPAAALAVTRLGTVAHTEGDYATAKKLHERALSTFRRNYGEDSPNIGMSLHNIALAEASLGQFPQAEAHYEAAIDSWERVVGVEHPDVARALGNLAWVLVQRGDIERAKQLRQRELATLTRIFGPDHVRIGEARVNLGSLFADTNEYERALSEYRLGEPILIGKLGPRHRSVGVLRYNIADAERALGNYAVARTQYQAALDILEHDLGPKHPASTTVALGLAKLELAEGHTETALVLARRTLSSRIAQGVATDVAQARFFLARVLSSLEDASDAHRLEARREAAAAHDAFNDASMPQQRDEVLVWLEEHPAPGSK